MSTNPFRDVAVPLRTLDPATADMSDLKSLRDMVGTARVVAIGESAHCAREFYQLKDRLFRYLVSECGFTAFVMESGFPEALVVNDWVLGGAGDLEQIAATGITYRFGECEEMRAQLQWMRDWNASHDRKLRFYGMDVPGSQATPMAAIEACVSRLEPHPEDAALLMLANLGERFTAMARYAAMDATQRDRLSKGIALLVERAKASGDEVALRCALGAERLDDLLTHDLSRGGGRNLRDELMADNIAWILEREERIVIGAHNGHIQRGPFQGMPMLGQILAPVLGDDLVVIGTTRASGRVPDVDFAGYPQPHGFTAVLQTLSPPPGHTVDALMDEVGPALHLVDLRRVPADAVASALAMCAQNMVIDVDVKRAFDALVHVRQLTTVPGAFEALRDAIALANIRIRP